MATNRQPLGIELVKRGIVKQEDIEKALEYQKNNPKEKLGDILFKTNAADPTVLLNAMGEILDEKVIFITKEKVKIKLTNYISMDVAREDMAIPFDINDGISMFCKYK